MDQPDSSYSQQVRILGDWRESDLNRKKVSPGPLLSFQSYWE